MNKQIKEGISGVIHMSLKDKMTGEVYEEVGKNAGIEIVDFSLE